MAEVSGQCHAGGCSLGVSLSHCMLLVVQARNVDDDKIFEISVVVVVAISFHHLHCCCYLYYAVDRHKSTVVKS